MKSQAYSHLKTKRLRRHLKIPHYAAVGLLESLWQVVAEHAPEGRLSDLDPEELAEEIGWEDEPAALIDALVETGWVDRDESLLFVHDWSEHCPDHIHRRLYRRVERFANGSIPNRTKCTKAEREEADPKWAALAAGTRSHHEVTVNGSRVDHEQPGEPSPQSSPARPEEPTGVSGAVVNGSERSAYEATAKPSRSDHELGTHTNTPTHTNTNTRTQGDGGGGGGGRRDVPLHEIAASWEVAGEVALAHLGENHGEPPDRVQALAAWAREQSNARNPVGLFLTRLKAREWPPDEFVNRWHADRRSARRVKATIDKVYQEANS